MYRILALIQAGGPMILVIVFASIIALALILEGLWVIGRSRRRLTQCALDPGQEAAPQKGDLVSSLLLWLNARPQAQGEEQERALRQLLQGQERKISWLSVIAAISPLLGLLGTVSGMIQIFSFVSVTKPTNPIAELSRGISEALVCTGGGLVVALLAAIGHHYLMNSLDDLGERVLDWMKNRKRREVSVAGK